MMSKTRALAEARSRWGRYAVVRLDRAAPLAPEKEPLRERMKFLRAENKPETREERNLLAMQICRSRCSVGEASALAFHVRGWGDTWEEAFKRADQK